MTAGLETPVPLLQKHVEFRALLNLYQERKPKRVLEIGTFHGGTLYHWLRQATTGAVVVSVDSYAVGADNRHLYPEWVPAGVRLHVIGGDSRSPETIAQVAAQAPFDWCFVDADHSYEAVADDWRNYRPMVRGVLCLHDIIAAHVGVPHLWREIQRQGYLTQELVGPHQPGEPEWGLRPDTPWGGIGLVYL